MKYLQRFKFIVLLILVMLIFGGNLTAQTPQYYNFDTIPGGTNSSPFAQTGGKGMNNLFLAGEFNKPTPLPAGKRITAIYFNTATAGTRTYTNFQILLKQDTITTLTAGSFYPGPYDTVFVGDTSLTSTVGGWMKITLKNKFNYDPTKSLILFVGQCGASGTGLNIYNAVMAGSIRRTLSVGGCPFVVATGGDAIFAHFGVDVESVIGVENNSTPVKFKLYDNYPNPFNPATTIKYDLAERTYVMLQIFDNAGRLVETLQNGYQTAGVYEKTFEGKNLSSGIYYYKLSAGNNVETRKMVLVK